MYGLNVNNKSGYTVIDSTYRGLYQVAEGVVTLSNGFAALPEPNSTYGTNSTYYIRDQSNGTYFLRVGTGYNGYGVYSAGAVAGSGFVYGTGNVYYKVFNYSTPIDGGTMGLKVYSGTGVLLFNSDKNPLQIVANLKAGTNELYPINEYLIGTIQSGYTPFINPKVGNSSVLYAGGFPPTIIVHEVAANTRFDGTNYYIRTKNFSITSNSNWFSGYNHTLGTPGGAGVYEYLIAGAVI